MKVIWTTAYQTGPVIEKALLSVIGEKEVEDRMNYDNKKDVMYEKDGKKTETMDVFPLQMSNNPKRTKQRRRTFAG